MDCLGVEQWHESKRKMRPRGIAVRFTDGEDRLEYLTANDWVLIVDRAKRTVFKKDDILIQAGKQNKTVYLP